ALADRAAVYRAQRRHYDALFDLAAAVHIDPKYTAEYMVQRGIVAGTQGEYNRAAADFLVALALDPTNKGAQRGKALVEQLRDARGPAAWARAAEGADRGRAAEHALNGGPGSPGGGAGQSRVQPGAVAGGVRALSAGRKPEAAAEPASAIDLADESSFDLAP